MDRLTLFAVLSAAIPTATCCYCFGENGMFYLFPHILVGIVSNVLWVVCLDQNSPDHPQNNADPLDGFREFVCRALAWPILLPLWLLETVALRISDAVQHPGSDDPPYNQTIAPLLPKPPSASGTDRNKTKAK